MKPQEIELYETIDMGEYEIFPPSEKVKHWVIRDNAGDWLTGLYNTREAAEKAYTLDKDLLNKVVETCRKDAIDNCTGLGVVSMELIDKLIGEEE